MPTARRLTVVLLVALHIALLAAYTFPQQVVPERLRIAAQLYARPLFHQQWRLFAPDPPLCSCAIEVRIGEEAWRPITRAGDGYLDRRMAQSIARNAQRAFAEGHVRPEAPVLRAMQALVRDIGREAPDLRFRLVERCIVEATDPERRVERITEIPVP